MSYATAATRFGVKIYLEHDTSLDLEACIGTFHRWIQECALNELMIDVADYRHVPQGPGVLLICHAAHYALDALDGRPGLRFEAKRDQPAELSLRLNHACASVFRAAQLLQQGAGGASSMRFDPSGLRITVQDRLLAPNNHATRAALLPALEQTAQTLYGAAGSVERLEGDPRQAFSAHLSGSTPAPALSELLTRVELSGS